MIFARSKRFFDPTYGKEDRYEFNENEPVWKLTVVVYKVDSEDNAMSPVVMQVTETIPPNFTNPENTEFELDHGTHTIGFVNEVFGIRFRASQPGGVALVSFRAYGPGEN